MSQVAEDLYALAGRLVDIEREMRAGFTFQLVRERDDVMREVQNLGRRERGNLRPHPLGTPNRPWLTLHQ